MALPPWRTTASTGRDTRRARLPTADDEQRSRDLESGGHLLADMIADMGSRRDGQKPDITTFCSPKRNRLRARGRSVPMERLAAHPPATPRAGRDARAGAYARKGSVHQSLRHR